MSTTSKSLILDGYEMYQVTQHLVVYERLGVFFFIDQVLLS